jgi:TonB family protein
MDPVRMPPRASERVSAWILALMFHAALIIASAGVAISAPTRAVPEIGIDLSAQSSAGTEEAGGAGPENPGPQKTQTEGADLASLPVRPVQANRAKASARPQVSGNPLRGVETREDPLQAASAAAVPAALSGIMPAADAAQDSAAMQLPPEGGIGWDGSARKLIHGRDPAFPAQLSAAGQEVECEARITVAASGAVIRVEITRSSGYIEIDASVEAALRDYLFSRVTERKDTVGTIRFRFRLERQD